MSYEPLDPAEYKRQAVLLKALHCAHPVSVEGKSGFIHTLSTQANGGRIEMTVYLAGSPEPVAACRVEIQITTN